MKRLAWALLCVVLPVPVATGICNLPPPAIPPDATWDATPPPGDPVPTPTPTPGPGPVPTPRGSPKPPTTPDPRNGGRTGARTPGVSYAASWHLWWELNREHLLGLRQSLKRRDVITLGPGAGPTGVLDVTRDRVREALREVAARAGRTDLRAAALCALGRAGNDEDARTFVRLLRAREQPREVREAAAIALGCLPRIEQTAVRLEVRGLIEDLLAGRVRLPRQAHLLAVMAVSLRAREDRALGWSLAARCAEEVRSADEGASLLYGCGLARHPGPLPTLVEAARTGRLGKRRLHDLARSHATLALALSGDAGAATTLVQILRSRRARIHTRRSAALALGLVLRREDLDERQRLKAQHALAKAFDDVRDPVVKGYCAVGMGTAHRPFGLQALVATVDRSGDRVVRPYAALALGLAARRLDGKEAREVKGFLLQESQKAKDIQLAAALSLAVGVSGAKEAKEHLFARLATKRLQAAVRGPAIQGLGLLGETDRRIEQTLVAALDEGADEVVEDAAIALGFLGTRTTARLLVRKLAATRSEPVQAHMVAALSHLGGTAAIQPLLELLRDASRKHTVRASAAAALGILVDVRARDPLFEIDAHTNPYGLTLASRK
ncbi:MAG: hypothetical protein ACYTFD_13700, partial [Planctomycetota bacterium]